MSMMRIRGAPGLLFVLILVVTVAGRAAAQPAAPTPLAPAAGASVTVPFTISWSAVTDPSGIVAYNWQVSASSSFSSVPVQNRPTASRTTRWAGWRTARISGASRP
jgi:hypothetical protein